MKKPNSKEVYSAILYGSGAVAFILLLVMFTQILSIVTAIHQSQQDRAPLIKSTNQSAQAAESAAKSAAEGTRLIESCLNIDGKCFKDSQKRSGAILTQFNQWTVATAVCAATLLPQDPNASQKVLVDRVTACAVARLARQGKASK